MRKAGIDKRIDNVVIMQSGFVISDEDMFRLIYESIFCISGRKEADLKKSKPPCILDVTFQTEVA